jgi:hypothetical protein
MATMAVPVIAASAARTLAPKQHALLEIFENVRNLHFGSPLFARTD